MICSRCRQYLRKNDSIKCANCESKCPINCAINTYKRHGDAGDGGYQLKCTHCQKYYGKLQAEKQEYKRNVQMQSAILSLCEKIEMVNKIQLPKINSDLTHVKSLTDGLVKQNDHILHKINHLDVTLKCKDKNYCMSFQNYRKRNIKLNPNSKNNLNDAEFRSILPNANRPLRYRPRRRSYLLNKMFRLLNRNLTKHTSRNN